MDRAVMRLLLLPVAAAEAVDREFIYIVFSSRLFSFSSLPSFFFFSFILSSFFFLSFFLIFSPGEPEEQGPEAPLQPREPEEQGPQAPPPRGRPYRQKGRRQRQKGTKQNKPKSLKQNILAQAVDCGGAMVLGNSPSSFLSFFLFFSIFSYLFDIS